MLKKILATLIIIGAIGGGAAAYACDCEDTTNRTYVYEDWQNDTHMNGYICHNLYCDDPFTLLGREACTYEIQSTGELSCSYCGHVLTQVPITSISITNATDLYMTVGETFNLDVSVQPSNASNTDLLYIANPDILSIDSNGVITAIGTGYTYVDVMTTDGTELMASCNVYVIDSSLVGYWNFNGDALDRGSIGGADGSLYNGTATYSTGQWWQSLNLEGTRDYVRVYNNYTNFNNMNSFTLSAWVNPKSYNSCNPIINKVTPNRDFMFEINSAGKASFHFAINYSTYYTCVSNANVPLDTWTHLAVTVTPTSMKIYQNGVLVGTRTLSNISPQWTGSNMQIGGFIGSYFFPGSLDEVKIFNKELSQSEVLNEYQNNGF